jgi:hypothetical protein
LINWGDTIFSSRLSRIGFAEQGRSIVESGDGGYFIAGIESNFPDHNIYFAKTDSLGKTGCHDRYALISSLGALNLQVTGFTPSSTASPAISQFVLPMEIGSEVSENIICSSIGISEVNSAQQLQIFPNPSEGIFHISFSEKNPYKRLMVFNSMGERILQKDIPGEENVEINLSNQIPGIYLARLENENQFQTARICLTR